MSEDPTAAVDALTSATGDALRAEEVQCPDCMAPAGQPCRVQGDYTHHALRLHIAVLHAAEHGTCALCTRPMVRLVRQDGSTDVFHPDPDDAAACPKIPDPNLDGWNAYAAVVNSGLTPGRPGHQHFVPAVGETVDG